MLVCLYLRDLYQVPPVKTRESPRMPLAGRGEEDHWEIHPGIFLLARLFSGETVSPEPNFADYFRVYPVWGKGNNQLQPMYPSCPT